MWHSSENFQLVLGIIFRVSPEDQEELAYLSEALNVLKRSLEVEDSPAAQEHVRERRIATARQTA